MSCEKEDKQWGCAKAGSVNLQKVSAIVRDIGEGCGKAGSVNLQKVSAIVRDMGEPCLHQSPIKVVIAVRLWKIMLFLYNYFVFENQNILMFIPISWYSICTII